MIPIIQSPFVFNGIMSNHDNESPGRWQWKKEFAKGINSVSTLQRDDGVDLYPPDGTPVGLGIDFGPGEFLELDQWLHILEGG